MIINKPYQGFPDSLVGKETTCNAWDPGSIPGWGISTREGIGYALQYSWASFVTQLVKNPPAMQETWVPSLGRSPGGGKGYPLQYSGLENSMGCIVHWVAKSPTRLREFHFHLGDFPVAQMVRNQPAMQETRVWSLGQGSPSGEGNDNPLQYSCLENSMDTEAWWATVLGVAKSRTGLSD